jgi:hypothetical protein
MTLAILIGLHGTNICTIGFIIIVVIKYLLLCWRGYKKIWKWYCELEKILDLFYMDHIMVLSLLLKVISMELEEVSKKHMKKF